jgi:hypothetical protein
MDPIEVARMLSSVKCFSCCFVGCFVFCGGWAAIGRQLVAALAPVFLALHRPEALCRSFSDSFGAYCRGRAIFLGKLTVARHRTIFAHRR